MKYLIAIISIVISHYSSAQALTYRMFDSEVLPNTEFQQYLSKDSGVFTLGDALVLGSPSKDSGYRFAQLIDDEGSYLPLPNSNGVRSTIIDIAMDRDRAYGTQCRVRVKTTSGKVCNVLLDSALLVGEVHTDKRLEAQHSVVSKPLKADENDRSVLLASGLALEKAKKAKVASLCLATTAGVFYTIGITQPQGNKQFMYGLGLASGLASVLTSFSSIRQIGRSGAYIQAYASGVIIRF